MSKIHVYLAPFHNTDENTNILSKLVNPELEFRRESESPLSQRLPQMNPRESS